MLTSKDKVILKFMETTIDRVNSCLANIRATQEVLIEKGLITQSEFIRKIKEIERYPDMKAGREFLTELINKESDRNKEILSDMIQELNKKEPANDCKKTAESLRSV